ncbi:hypothetical protein VP01_661g2 [Puccinia sorghi]|uniref:Uncharacterized protein n=1 Tax=Puccinia sorghi TaxID=27349 RepID=A0A0L6UFZ5_9BASI|nr:hypothetical protein VP01_661g2 [Puccinia sorghi]
MGQFKYISKFISAVKFFLSIAYKCLWCKKEVHVSGSSLWLPTTSRSHQRGFQASCHISSQEIKIKKNTKEGSIYNHINQAEKILPKLSITLYLFGFYFKQSLGTVLKTHIFEQPFTTVFIVIYSCYNLFQQATNSKFTLIHDAWTAKGNLWIHWCISFGM